MRKPGRQYKILYADKAEAIGRGGLVFPSQLSAEDYVMKANQETPRFHHWVEPMPESQEELNAILPEVWPDTAPTREELIEKLTGYITAPNPIFTRLTQTK